MKSVARDSLLVFVLTLIAAANGQMSGMGENGSGNGTDSDQSDSSEPLSREALIGIYVGGGVVLLTVVVIIALCVVCCIWRKRRRQKSMAHYDPEVYTNDNNPSPPSSTHSSLSSTMAARLLSTRAKAKKIPQQRDSDLTTGVTPASNSNPLYNSSSIAYLPSNTENGAQQIIAESPLSSEVPPPSITVSSRRHSLGYVEMQSAGSARSGIHASHSMENFTDYASVRDGSYKVPFAPPSFTPPSSSLLTASLPASRRHNYLSPDRPPAPSPSPPHSHPPTPPTKKPKPTKKQEEEEDRGGEDEYVDPKLFLEEIQQEEEDRPEDEYEEMKDQTDFFFTTNNTAYRNSTLSNDHPTADSAHQPHPATLPSNGHTPSSPTQPSYENIIHSEEMGGEGGWGGPYISDSYEPIDEFLGNGPDTNERAALLATNDDRKISRTAPSAPSKHGGPTNKGAVPNLKESHSFDRKLSMDDQYVEVISPVRKTKSLKPRLARVNPDDEDDTPELEYQNVIPGMTVWGDENETESPEHTVKGERSEGRGQRSSPGEQENEKTIKKSPSPTPRTKTSPKPKPKPKPHPSQIPASGGKPRSKSHDTATVHTTQQPLMRVVIGGQSSSSSRDKTRAHLEEMVFPVANGNVITHGNSVAVGNGGSRFRSTTVPVGGCEVGEGGEELYVNVGDRGGRGAV